jgi:hypothetical protein
MVTKERIRLSQHISTLLMHRDAIDKIVELEAQPTLSSEEREHLELEKRFIGELQQEIAAIPEENLEQARDALKDRLCREEKSKEQLRHEYKIKYSRVTQGSGLEIVEWLEGSNPSGSPGRPGLPVFLSGELNVKCITCNGFMMLRPE